MEHVTVPVPEPGPGQVLLAMKASSICGSDIRAIYREHLGSGPEAYRGVIAGHDLPWHVQQLGCRAEYWFAPPPRDGATAAAAGDAPEPSLASEGPLDGDRLVELWE